MWRRGSGGAGKRGLRNACEWIGRVALGLQGFVHDFRASSLEWENQNHRLTTFFTLLEASFVNLGTIDTQSAARS